MGIHKTLKRIAAVCCLAWAMTFALPCTLAHATWESPNYYPGTIRRWYGTTRYGTAEYITSEVFSWMDADVNDRAIVVTGENFPDALAASALAGVRECPVLLAQPEDNPGDTSVDYPWGLKTGKNQGIRKDVYIVGGAGAVGTGVEKVLKMNGCTVRRIAGQNRVGTSLAVLAEVRRLCSKSDTIIVATGKTFADSLSISPWSYASKSPIVLTANSGKLTSAAVKAIKSDKYCKRIILVGGTTAVRDDVKKQLGSKFEYLRLGGRNRYETGEIICDWTLKQKGFTNSIAAIATGANFPDALVGGVACGRMGVALHLTNGTSIPRYFAKHDLTGYDYHLSTCIVIGGEYAVDFGVDKYIMNKTSLHYPESHLA